MLRFQKLGLSARHYFSSADVYAKMAGLEVYEITKYIYDFSIPYNNLVHSFDVIRQREEVHNTVVLFLVDTSKAHSANHHHHQQQQLVDDPLCTIARSHGNKSPH